MRPKLHLGAPVARKSIACARVSSHDQEPDREEDLAEDVLEIITVFSARLYGSRSRKNQKLPDGVQRAVKESQC